jgi:hypothetical protein
MGSRKSMPQNLGVSRLVPTVSRLLKIADTRPVGQGRAFLPLSEILDSLSPDADRLVWSIFDLREAVPVEGSGIDPAQIDQEARTSPTGLHKTFPALRDLAEHMTQIIDGLFVGSAEEGRLPQASQPDVSIIEQADMVVAAIDSSFWLVAAPDRVLDRFAQTFSKVAEVDPVHAQIRQ